MSIFKHFLQSSKTKLINQLKQNAVIIDVRTIDEFNSGHIKGALNFPLQSIHTHFEELKSIEKPIIVCCASGIRSAKAKSILRKNNISSLNGGGWASLNKLILNLK